MKRILLFLFLLGWGVQLGFAQQPQLKDERYIFVWDITHSMKGLGSTPGPDIWNPVVEQMSQSVDAITDERTEIVVLAYQDEAYRWLWRENATAAGKKQLLNEIEATWERIKEEEWTRTNLYAPLNYAIREVCNPDRINYLIFMTDGVHNSKKNSMDDMRRLIGQWCDLAEQSNTYACYVALTATANNEELTGLLIENCFRPINTTDLSKIRQVTPATNAITINVRDDYNKPKRVSLRVKGGNGLLPVGYKLHATVSENEYYTLDEVVTVGTDNTVQISPRFKVSKAEVPAFEGEMYQTLMLRPEKEMSAGDYQYVIYYEAPISVTLINKPEKTVNIYVK